MQPVPPQLTSRFLAAVRLASEVHGAQKAPWRERKERYLEHLPQLHDEGALRVSLADKVHNGRSIVRDYRAEGDALWARFATKTADDQLWYYRRLACFFSEHRPGPLSEDLKSAVAELADLLERGEAVAGASRPRRDGVSARPTCR